MNSNRNILVCVTQQKTCERLIKKASSLVKEPYGNLFVIHVAKNEWKFLDSAKEGEALEYLFGVSKAAGANLTVIKSDEIVSAIVDFVIENEIDCIIMGNSNNDHKENHFYKDLKSKLGNIEIQIISQNDT